MFEPCVTPRIFGLAPGVDFPAALVSGLRQRAAGMSPEAFARVEIFVNTRRMQRRISEVFASDGAFLLPRVRLVSDLAFDPTAARLPAPVPPLRRRLQLAQLVAKLLDQEPGLAPRSAIFDLADSLANVLDEMQGEGVPIAALETIDTSEHSEHWERSLKFLRIAGAFFEPGAEREPDVEARQRQVVEALARSWAAKPPDHPILVAGSTGSRGTTALFMRAVAALPQGALIVPGFDFDQPPRIWDSMSDVLTAEDHPQFRFRRLLDSLGLEAGAVRPWADVAPPNPPRNRLVSLALRPAPVTDQWIEEGPGLTGVAEACSALTLIEAPSPRREALAIALCLREAAEGDKVAALITPDRELTRRVTATLDRWGIRPDDSAGRPLALSAPGRFLRHVAALFGQKLTSQALLTLLKHPITNTGGAQRGEHLLWTRDLELKLRRHGPTFPDGASLKTWAKKREAKGLADWAAWLAGLLDGLASVGERSLSDHADHLVALAEALAKGPAGTDTGELWRESAGVAARATVDELLREAGHGGVMPPREFEDLFTALLDRREVREAAEVHPRIRIWGTLEARVQGADVVILGGLNDGVWPRLPPPDPWLSRQMRREAGLLLPERQIGLSAHDFQQAIAARAVILTRAKRSDDAETVPSRWLNRLTNLLGGLEGSGGTTALKEMQARGAVWLARAVALDEPAETVPPAKRPSPRPPLEVRPNELAVTGIRALIRDPYEIYARHILRLRPLDPLKHMPDARLRGSVLHSVLERFVQERGAGSRGEERQRLLEIADEVMQTETPWPSARRLWRARLERAADWFLAGEEERGGTPAILEEEGKILLDQCHFTLKARPDRIDILPDGRLHILDYKTGSPPTKKQQELFDKQLLLEAAMARQGAFAKLGKAEVEKVTYIGLGSTPKEEIIPITPEICETVWQDLGKLIARYQSPEQGYTARRAVFEERFPGDYDHLARYGEWDMTDLPNPETVE